MNRNEGVLVMKIALQMYSVRDAYEKDYKAALKRVKDLGFDCVELYGGYGIPVEDLKACIDSLGIGIAGFHTSSDLIEFEPQEAIEYNKKLGNKYIIAPNMASDERVLSSEGYEQSATSMNAANKAFLENGMRAGFHSHEREHTPFPDGRRGWDIFGELTDSDFILQLDTGNCLKAGDDPVEQLRKWSNKAYSIHYKPYSLEKGFDCVMGEDSIDWKSIYRETKKCNVCEYIVIEYEILDDFYGVTKCLEFLKKLIAEN